MGYVDKSGRMIQQTDVEMDEKLFFHHWNLVNSVQLHPPHLLQFKIITLTFQTCTGQGPNEGASTTNNPMGKTNFILCNTKYWPLEGKQIRCHACSMKNKEMRTKFICPQCIVGGVLILVSNSTIQNCISADCPTSYCNKCNIQMQVILHLILFWQ
jgi:hypothetical protein